MQIGLGLWLGTRQVGGFSPATLFAAGEQGGWYDPSDLSTMFQDSAGTTPVTATGQTVGLLLDKSQGLALGPELVTNGTFDTNLSGWTVGTDPAQVIPTWNNGRVSLARAAGGISGFSQGISTTVGRSYVVSFTVVSGTAAFGGGFPTIGGLAVGQVSRILIATGSSIGFWPNSLNSTTVIDNISVKELAGNHLTQATAASRPQYQIDANGLPFLLFDGTDDWFISPTITPGIDKAQVFAGVRKLSDATQGVIAESSASTAANNGALLLAAPDANTTATYGFDSKGTVQVDAVASSLVAPLTSVLTGIADISGDNTLIRVNGVQADADTSDQGTGNYLAYPLYVGRRGGTTIPFNGRMYQLIVRFGANLDASTIAATETFVNNKTGAYGFAAAPSNYDAIFFGDSRTENGFAPNVNTGGYAANLNNVGVAAQLGPMSGHRLRVGKFANFGIGGGTSIQAAFDPRQAASGSVTTGQWWRGGQTDSPTNSGSSNKSISDAIAHPAGIVVMLMNTNDGPTNWPVNSRTAMTTIINALTAAGKVVVLLNETPRGVNSAGALQSDLSAANMALFKDLSDWLSKWAFDSGDVLANPRVIVIDSWNEFYDPATGANYYNKVGYLHDGLHFTPFASKRLAQMIDSKLSSVWRQYAALPRRTTLPTANGFAAITNTTPYLNSNPIFTPGTNGTVSGTWGSAPTAATVCQGWTIAGSGTISGINLVAEKGVDTDPDGFPVQKLTVTGGSLANLGTATVILQQSFTNIAALTSAGMLSLTSKLRAMARVKIDAGSNLLSSVNVSLTVFADTTAKNLTARTMRTSSFLPLNRVVDMGDGEWYDYVTELLDIAEPNMSPTPGNPSSITSMVFTVNMQFDNRTGATATPSAVVRIARAGPYVTAD